MIFLSFLQPRTLKNLPKSLLRTNIKVKKKKSLHPLLVTSQSHKNPFFEWVPMYSGRGSKASNSLISSRRLLLFCAKKRITKSKRRSKKQLVLWKNIARSDYRHDIKIMKATQEPRMSLKPHHQLCLIILLQRNRKLYQKNEEIHKRIKRKKLSKNHSLYWGILCNCKNSNLFLPRISFREVLSSINPSMKAAPFCTNHMLIKRNLTR